MRQTLITLAAILLVMGGAFALSAPALAIVSNQDQIWGTGVKREIENGPLGGATDNDPRLLAVKIINIALGFLGIIAVVLILYAGFRWMTAGGNEENVAAAKKILSAGGIVAMPKFAIGGMAWQGYFLDTEGNTFGLHQTDPKAK